VGADDITLIYMATDIFGTLVLLDTIWVKLEGHGHRSKFKFTGENVVKVGGATSSEDFLVRTKDLWQKSTNNNHR